MSVSVFLRRLLLPMSFVLAAPAFAGVRSMLLTHDPLIDGTGAPA